MKEKNEIMSKKCPIGRQTVEGGNMMESFKLKGVSLENVLRFLGKTGHKFWLKVFLEDGREGNIWVNDGKVLHAVIGELHGISAVAAMLGFNCKEISVFREFVGSIVKSIDEPVEEVLEKATKSLPNEEKKESEKITIEKKGEVNEMLDETLKKLKTDIPHCLGIGVFHTTEGLMLGAVTDLPGYDHDVAGAAYSTMMNSIKKALSLRGEGIYVNIKDVLVETDDKYLYVRTLGNTNYAVVAAISKEGSIGFLRAMLKKAEPELLRALP